MLVNLKTALLSQAAVRPFTCLVKSYMAIFGTHLLWLQKTHEQIIIPVHVACDCNTANHGFRTHLSSIQCHILIESWFWLPVSILHWTEIAFALPQTWRQRVKDTAVITFTVCMLRAACKLCYLYICNSFLPTHTGNVHTSSGTGQLDHQCWGRANIHLLLQATKPI